MGPHRRIIKVWLELLRAFPQLFRRTWGPEKPMSDPFLLRRLDIDREVAEDSPRFGNFPGDSRGLASRP